jgi:ketosteroid isomerase-like protein
MADLGPLGSKWAACAEAWSGGALDAWDGLFADDCVWDGPQGRVSGSAAIVAGLSEIRKAFGWQAHEVVSCSEGLDGVVALLGKNTFASGATTSVAAGLLFVDGKVSEIRSVGGLPDVL